MADYFKHFIYTLEFDIILSTNPKRLRKCKNLISIFDCSEIFIEIRKDLQIQSAILPDYKH